MGKVQEPQRTYLTRPKYIGVGVKSMNIEEMMAHVSNLAKKTPPVERQLTPLTTLQKQILKIAKLNLEKTQVPGIKEIVDTHRIPQWKAEKILETLRRRGLIEAGMPGGPEKRRLDIRQADENHPWFKNNISQVNSLATYYKKLNTGFPLDDLKNEGKKGLLRATELYNPEERGKHGLVVSFREYARQWIRARILGFVKRERKLKTVPIKEEDFLTKSGQEGILEEAETAGKLLKLHKQMHITEAQLVVLLLNSIHGLSYSEIGKVLGFTRSAASNQGRNALKKAKQHLRRFE